MAELTAAQVRTVLESYGAGQVSAAETAARLRPDWEQAVAEKARRRANGDSTGTGPDPDAASVPTVGTYIALAHMNGTITTEQRAQLYAELP